MKCNATHELFNPFHLYYLSLKKICKMEIEKKVV